MTSSNWNRSTGLASRDDLLSILSSECAQDVVQYFQESPEQVAELVELADFVATRKDDPAFDDPDRVSIYLHHVCIPKLCEAGIVDYDLRHNTVRYRGHPLVETHSNFLAEACDGA